MAQKNPFALLFLLLTILISSLHAQSPQHENQQIEKLEILIEDPLQDCEREVQSLKSRIKTQEGDFFSQSDFDQDLKTLSSDFDRIDPVLESINGKMHIRLKVWPRPLIRSISWIGNHHLTSSVLQKELNIKQLSPFDRQAFNKAFHKVKAYYVRSGFFEAELDYKIVPDPNCNEVDIQIVIHEGRAGHIRKIIFCGFTEDEESDLVDMIATKEYNMLFSWYTNEGLYHEEAIQQDQFIILNYLQNKGYADAKVDVNVIEVAKNRIDVRITGERGDLYRIDSTSFTGNTIFDNEAIQKEFTFCQGSPYSPEEIRETVANITSLYGRRGYIDATVDFEPSLNPECLTYSISMTIEEGRQYRVGMIKVIGNCTTQTNIILHESLLIPGEIFNNDKLKLTEQKLKNVGYFENVNVFAVKSDGVLGLGDSYRDIHIEVKETSTGNIGAFLGYSTAESLFGGVNITERNFNYKGLFNVCQEGCGVLRGGGEYAHATAQLGLKSRKYIFSWAKPFFRDSQWTVGFDIEKANNHYISNNYDIDSIALIIHATYRINEFVRFGWHYRLKNSKVHFSSGGRTSDSSHRHRRKFAGPDLTKITEPDPTKPDPTEEKKDKKKHKEPTAEEIADSKIAGLVSGTGISLSYDSTDHPVTPRSGFKSRFEFELVGIGGDHSFLSFAYLNSYFLPIGKKNIVRTHADFRFISPFSGTTPGTIPLDERLFLGGDTLVRGYRSYRLGPLYPRTNNPKGGVSQQYYSIEFARKLHDRFEGFVFCDAGFLSSKEWRISNPNYSVGAGARVKIIESIPTLMVGYGIPINPKRSTQVKRFFISIGGKF